jgi:hypothetical protein
MFQMFQSIPKYKMWKKNEKDEKARGSRGFKALNWWQKPSQFRQSNQALTSSKPG